jgi:hypothetical protein
VYSTQILQLGENRMFSRILLALSLAVSAMASIPSMAKAALPNQGGIVSLMCPPAHNQVNSAYPSFIAPFSFDPFDFNLFSNCRPVGNGGLSNPLFYYYDAIDASFAPPSGMTDVLNWSPNSAKPTSKVCKAKGNLAKKFVISLNYITTGPGAGSYDGSIYLCRDLAPMKLKKGMSPTLGLKIQANLLRSGLWLAGQHAADPINWNQQGYGTTTLKVYNLHGVMLP